jgi:hypothetical protein
MGGDGVTKVISRRLPREAGAEQGSLEAGQDDLDPGQDDLTGQDDREAELSPPPFAGIAPADEGPAGGLGENPPVERPSRGDSSAAAA